MDKQILRAITKVEDWHSFEEFVFGLYKQNEHVLKIDRNFKANGASGRPREVDVLVTFGFAPHVLTLGVECKYWSAKVDGDIIDVAVAKRDDLHLDKYAVVTTEGYESGSEKYAADRGIDLFLVRVPHDDDFGYSGRIVRFTFKAVGSSIENVGVGANVISSQGDATEAARYAAEKLSHLKYSTLGSPDIDHEVDVYRYRLETGSEGTRISRLDFVDNLASLIDKERLKHTKSLYEGKAYTKLARIQFKSDSGVFLSSGAIAHLNEIQFDLRYFLNIWKMQIDRAASHPLIIENVIQDTITPLRQELAQSGLSMDRTIPVEPVDLSKRPSGVVGREGVLVSYMYTFPLDPKSFDATHENYEFKQVEDKCEWVKMEHI